MALIKELFKIRKGRKEILLDKPSTESIRYIQIEDLRSDNNIKYCKLNDKSVVVKPNDIIIAWDGANAGTVGTGLSGVIGSTLAKLEPKVDGYISYYIARYLKSKFRYLRDNCTGATIPHINKTVLESLNVPLPPFQIQKKIVAVLDKAQALIDAREEQVKLLDDLIQATFYDMFGDPVTNPNGWEIRKIGDMYIVKTGATPSRKNNEFWESGSIPWVKTNEVVFKTIYSTNEKINALAIEKSNVTLLPVNTLVIAMYGQGKTRGRVGKLGVEATTNQACAALLPTNEVNTDYMFNYLKVSYDELRNLGRGGNQPNLNLSLVRDFNIMIPPLSLQNQFAEIVGKIETQRQLMEESLVEMENNYNGLMQRAFKGELFSD